MPVDPGTSGTATITVLFCDLVSSTERLSRIGDIQGDAFRHEFTDRLARCVDESGGQVVKYLGDGAMVVFERSTVAALECAHRMHESFTDLHPDDPVRLRIGVSAGEVASEDGDWFGIPVVEAARLCARAEPGQTLAPALVESLVGSRAAEHRFTPVGPMELKGLPEPVAAVAVDHTDGAGVVDHIDGAGVVAVNERRRGTSTAKRRWVTIGVVIGMLGAVALGAVSAFGGGTPDAQSGPSDDSERSERGNAPGPVGYEPELVTVECDDGVVEVDSRTLCKELRVPESHDDPAGPTIAVSVVGIESDDPVGPPVLLLDVNEPVTRTPLVSAADVWSLTPRGFETDGSAARLCPGLSSAWAETLAMPSDSPEAISGRTAAATDCAGILEERGWNREGYNLAEIAADLRDLALTLGEEEYVVASGGYFTPAAATFIMTRRDLVRSVLLLNPTPPGDSMFSDASSNLAIHTEALSELCAQHEGCGPQFPDLSGAYEERAAQLALRPEMVSTNSLDGQGPFDVLLDDRRMAKAMQAGFQSTGKIELVPAAVLGASHGLSAAAGIAEDVGFFIGPQAIGPVILSSLCSYDVRNIQLSELVDAGHPAYAGASDLWIPEVCAAWDVPSVFAEVDHPFATDLPVLIGQGDLSVAGAQKWGETMTNYMPNATLLRFSTISEDLALATPLCLGKLRVAFIEDPSVVDGYDIEDCEAESPPIDFKPAPA